ncbi:HD domain-containing protein [Pseudomonas sp. KK4]|uniref:HD domain-containing protein n=1 Tax=Pseudomonas sp. KK4 TaxID=1855729 RepID=UPI00097C0B79|nr:HD domain-containing protein [Pseudomonas sp. KK4]
MTQTLEHAIAIAAGAHAGQVDKGGSPYILHALRVMLKVTTLEERIVAVLHDVVEDCDISLEELRQEGFSETVLTAIASVTRVDGETYEDFIARAAQNPIGRVVKRADLEENSDISRIAQPSWDDLERVEKYRRAIGMLR